MSFLGFEKTRRPQKSFYKTSKMHPQQNRCVSRLMQKNFTSFNFSKIHIFLLQTNFTSRASKQALYHLQQIKIYCSFITLFLLFPKTLGFREPCVLVRLRVQFVRSARFFRRPKINVKKRTDRKKAIKRQEIFAEAINTAKK